MAIEFTKLSEVPVAEQVNDTDNVLIEQDGEIKRAAKDQVGGAGGLVFELTEDMIDQEQSDDTNLVITASYDPIYETIMQGGMVWIYLVPIGKYYAAQATALTPDGLFVDIIEGTFLFPNGSYTPEASSASTASVMSLFKSRATAEDNSGTAGNATETTEEAATDTDEVNDYAHV